MAIDKSPVTPDQYTGTTTLVHLHNHSIYSSLDGVATPQQYANECVKRGYPAMSATEHGNMASVPDMALAFKKAGIKYIPGNEVYFNDHHTKAVEARAAGLTPQKANQSNDPEIWDQYIKFYRSRHITLLAKNQVGFENLIKMQTDANRDGLWRSNRPGRLWFEKLAKYSEGIIVLSGCLNGPVAHELRRRESRLVEVTQGNKKYTRVKELGDFVPRAQRLDAAAAEIRRFREVFKDDYYIELQMPLIRDKLRDGQVSDYRHGLLDLDAWHDSIMLADDFGLPVTIANDVHYLSPEDHMLQQLMMAIEQDLTLSSPDLFTSGSSEQYMKTRAELWATFRNNPYSDGVDDGLFERACDNTILIADKCRPLKIDTTPKIPKIPDADAMLRQMVADALREKGFDKIKTKYLIDGRMVTYVEQAEIETTRFIDKGFSSYFIITADLVRWGREQGYPFSPRGSAGGSLVCFLLGIHTLDPLKFGLSFDRFLSPSRGGFLLNVKMGEPIN